MTPQRTAQALEGLPGTVSSNVHLVSQSNFQLIDRAQWSAPLLREIGDFLDSEDTSHPFQWPQWSGKGMHLALLRHMGRVRWLTQCGVTFPAGRFLKPIRVLTVNRGPVCDDINVMELGLHKLVDEATKMGAAYIDITPEWTGTFAESVAAVLVREGWKPRAGVRSTLRLSLIPALDDLLAGFRKTTRYEIRRSMNEGIEVTAAHNEAEYQEFLRLYTEMANQRKFSAEKHNYLIEVFQWLATEQSRGGLFLAREAGKLCGGALVVRSGARCWYILGATSKEGKLGVGHLLQWHAIQWAKENGCLEYDFGGFREGMNTGPALFKKGFSDRVVHFLPTHRYIVSPVRYRASELVSRMRRSLQTSKP
jgi:Acetyltransferase (GNAT) domain